MNSWFRVIIMTLVVAIVPLNGCSQRKASESSLSTSTLDVMVSIVPQKYFVEQIGGKQVNVDVMVEPGVNYHIYEPKAEQLRKLAQAKAYFTIGISFEQVWMDRFRSTNSQIKIVDTTQGIELQPMIDHEHHQAENHGEENHGKESLDPHIWLSPKLVKQQSQTIYKTLVELDPANQSQYQENLQNFLQDIDSLDREIKNTLAGVKNRKFMVFHPTWGYFAKDYNLQMIPIEVGGTEPSASELAKFISLGKKEHIKVIFSQPEFSGKTAETIAKEIDAKVILIDPLAENWQENLQKIANTFSQTLFIP